MTRIVEVRNKFDSRIKELNMELKLLETEYVHEKEALAGLQQKCVVDGSSEAILKEILKQHGYIYSIVINYHL